MEEVTFARVLHVLGVVLWIGGVAMVTTVVLPAAKRMHAPAERIMFFEAVERRFALQARVTVLVTGLSGLYLVQRLDLWSRFAHVEFWWMHAMVLVWAMFMLVLFVLEPLFLHHWFGGRLRRDPESALVLAARFHWILLGLTLVTVAGAVSGSHGYLLFSR